LLASYEELYRHSGCHSQAGGLAAIRL